MPHVVTPEEVQDKIASLRAADRIGREFADNRIAISLAKQAGILLARGMTKEALGATVLGRLSTKVTPAAKAATGGLAAVKALPKPNASIALRPGLAGEAAVANMHSIPPLSSSQLAGNVKPAWTGAGKPVQGPVSQVMAANKPMASIPPRPVSDSMIVGRAIPGSAKVGPNAATGGFKAKATPKPVPQSANPAAAPGAVQTGPNAAKPAPSQREVLEGFAQYQKDPAHQKMIHDKMRAAGKSEEEISKYHQHVMGKDLQWSARRAGISEEGFSPNIRSPSGYSPMPGQMPATPQGAAYQGPGAKSMAEPAWVGNHSYPPQTPPGYAGPKPTPAPGKVTPPPSAASAAKPTGYASPGELQFASQEGVPAPGKLTQHHRVQEAKKALEGSAEPSLAELRNAQMASKPSPQPTMQVPEGLHKPTEVNLGAEPTSAVPKTAPAGTPAEVAKAEKGKTWPWMKTLGLAGLGLGAYGAMKGVPWAARQLEAASAGPQAYGGGWSPVPYGYGSTPYGPGGGMAAF